VRLPIEFYIARKYLLAKRKQTFISIITFISIGGVTVGVMALIIVLAVMGGFERELKDRILGATAHAHVTSLNGSIENPFAVTEMVRKVEGVVAASPYIFTPMMIARGAAPSAGCSAASTRRQWGRHPPAARPPGRRLEDLHRATKDGLPGVLLGKELAGNLGVGRGT